MLIYVNESLTHRSLPPPLPSSLDTSGPHQVHPWEDPGGQGVLKQARGRRGREGGREGEREGGRGEGGFEKVEERGKEGRREGGREGGRVVALMMRGWC